MKDEKFLEKYLNTKSPTGEEVKGQLVWLDYVKEFTQNSKAIDNYGHDIHIDDYGNAIARKQCIQKGGSMYKVLLDAHADEIAFAVNYIDSDGFLYLTKIGGADHQIAPSKKVNVHKLNGEIIPGIFGHPAVHVRKGKDKPVTMETINVDIGATTKEEVLELGVDVGSYITYPDTFMILNEDKYVGVSLDDKIGGYINAMVLKKIHEEKNVLPYNLVVANTVQEEIGLRGAQIVTQNIKPNVAIVIDVCHDTTTQGISKIVEGDYKIGEGVVIASGPTIQSNLHKLMVETAEEFGIAYKRSVTGRTTGTNTDSYAYSNGGTPSILLQLPMRYMHTTVETVHKNDVDACIELIYQTLLKIENNHDFSYNGEVAKLYK